MYELIESVFREVVQYAVLLTELIGVIVLIWTVIRSAIRLFFKKQRDGIRLALAEGTALALEFKMGGELLRTVIVREWNELLILGAVIVLRAALAFLIQWEIKNEKKNKE